MLGRSLGVLRSVFVPPQLRRNVFVSVQRGLLVCFHAQNVHSRECSWSDHFRGCLSFLVPFVSYKFSTHSATFLFFSFALCIEPGTVSSESPRSLSPSLCQITEDEGPLPLARNSHRNVNVLWRTARASSCFACVRLLTLFHVSKGLYFSFIPERTDTRGRRCISQELGYGGVFHVNPFPFERHVACNSLVSLTTQPVDHRSLCAKVSHSTTACVSSARDRAVSIGGQFSSTSKRTLSSSWASYMNREVALLRRLRRDEAIRRVFVNRLSANKKLNNEKGN